VTQMLEITFGEKGEIVLSGRFDASQEEKARAVFDAVTEPTVVDFGRLEYISSLGLGILLKTQKRLQQRTGRGLRFVRVNRHIQDIFRYSGFHQVFDIEVTEE